LKPARLRPKTRADRKKEISYYRKTAGEAVARKFVAATESALDQIESNPGTGSPRWAELLGIPGLKCWRLTDFPLEFFYFEREDYLDVVGLIGEQQDIPTHLGLGQH
jgi:toxin ParE1/3/4